MRKFGYWSETESWFFDDQTRRTWLHAVPLGQYDHPQYGVLDFTPDVIQRYQENIKNNVRGIQLDIDYDHKDNTGKAAGWVVDSRTEFGGPSSQQGLWLLVEWTPDAYQALKKKEYRYFSPEILDEWSDAKGNIYQDVIAGGGVTNRPFLKDLMPINLSELVTPEKEVSRVQPTEVAKTLSELLGREVKQDDIETELKKLFDEASKVPELSKKLADAAKPDPEEDRRMKFAEMFPDEAAQLAEQGKTIKLQETKGVVTRWLRNSESGLGISPAQAELVVGHRITLSEKDSKSFDEFMDDLTKNGLVNYKEVGNYGLDSAGNPIDDPSDDPIKKFMSEVKKYQSEHEGANLKDATREVARAHPQLSEAYLTAQRSKQRKGA